MITIAADATSATVLDGFTIRYGFSPIGSTWGHGGGICVTGGTPVISNNVIMSCRAQMARTTVSAGGGIYAEAGAQPLIIGNSITNNLATYGGGIYASGGLIRDNVISFNVANHDYMNAGSGGGIYLNGPAVVVYNDMKNNVATGLGGGGIYAGFYNGTAAMMDNAFLDNSGTSGAAILWNNSATVLRNTILDSTWEGDAEVYLGSGVFSNNLVACRAAVGLSLGNTFNGTVTVTNNAIIQLGPNGWGGVSNSYDGGETPVFSNNILMGWQLASVSYHGTNPPTFTADHNDVYGNGVNTLDLPGASQVGQDGNISQDPLFVDPANGDYRLQPGSPCIDAGNDAYVNSTDRDLAGAPRTYGAHVDIGAYEFGSPAWTMQDAAEVMKIAAGLSIATPAQAARLDTVAGGGITLQDATRIAQWLLN